MINLLHAEWIKLRTVTMNWVLGIIAGAFPLAVTLLTAYFNGDSSEFGTIRPTFAATQQRLRVVVAKGAVVVLATTTLATVVQLVGWFAGSAIARGRGATIDLAEVPTAVPAMVGAVVLTALMSLAGYGFGLITRSTPVAVSILIVWPLIAEGLVGGLLGLATDNDDIPRWMPFQAGIRLALVELVDDGPSRLMAGGYFGAVALLLVALGAWAVNRRDA